MGQTALEIKQGGGGGDPFARARKDGGGADAASTLSAHSRRHDTFPRWFRMSARLVRRSDRQRSAWDGGVARWRSRCTLFSAVGGWE